MNSKKKKNEHKEIHIQTIQGKPKTKRKCKFTAWTFLSPYMERKWENEIKGPLAII